MHAAQNRAAGLALRLGQRVLSVVKEEQAEICPVKLKPDTALLRACISYSAKPGLWAVARDWGKKETDRERQPPGGQTGWRTWLTSLSVSRNITWRLQRLRFSVHAVCLPGGTGLRLNLCWSLDMLAAPAHRATGVLTSTQADRSIRRINNPLQTLSQLVHSMIDSPHATDT